MHAACTLHVQFAEQPLHAHCIAQVLDQPLLYVDPEQCSAAGGVRNALASALCGAEVWGDALLASTELRGRDGMGRPAISAKQVSVADLEVRPSLPSHSAVPPPTPPL